MRFCHVYCKGLKGMSLFYRLEDFLVFYTLCSVIVFEMKLRVVAFSMMFNHVHSGIRDIARKTLSFFQKRLCLRFARMYNAVLRFLREKGG